MSNNYWEDEDEDLDTDQGFSGDGSDLIKKLRKAKRADEKRIKELTEQLEGLSKVQRERTVKEVLEKKGVKMITQIYLELKYSKMSLRWQNKTVLLYGSKMF